MVSGGWVSGSVVRGSMVSGFNKTPKIVQSQSCRWYLSLINLIDNQNSIVFDLTRLILIIF